jgi:kynurenine 3-monooxygenase
MIAIVGAGPVGSLLATYLARRGLDVTLYERRPDLRALDAAAAMKSGSAGRSINLAVSVRGLHALREVGLEDEVLAEAIPMRGRMMHAVDGALTFQRYGKDDSQCIHSLSRGWLNGALLTHAERTGRARIRFETKVTAFDPGAGAITVDGQELRPDVVFGTDGSASAVRAGIAAAPPARPVREDRLDYGYKELSLPPGAGGRHAIEKHALHIWPRGTYMLIALPNADGSFTCTLFLPFEGPLGFASLDSPAKVRDFFERSFPDALRLIPGVEEQFFANPTGSMVTVRSPSWSAANALLVGDAAHAIVPFFGQGMNCGFEDCSVLNAMLDESARPEWPAIFRRFEEARRPNTNAIADMAIENFVEMRDKVGQPSFLLQKEVEKRLERELPGEYVSRYALVTFSRAPYRLAFDVGVAAQEILAELCQGIRGPEEVDLARAAQLVRARITPLLKTLQK